MSRPSARRHALAVRVGAWTFGLMPLGLLAFRWLDGGLGANPIEALILHFGRWAIVLLIAALAVTPIRRATGFNALVRARRTLGLFGFAYVTLHFLTYVVLDQFFAWGYIWEDIAERPFITVGFAAFVLLIPLAVTSTKGWIRRLGRNWARLHRLFYVAAVLAVIHYFWNVRGDEPLPLLAILAVVALLAARLPWATDRARGRPLAPEPRAAEVGATGRGPAGGSAASALPGPGRPRPRTARSLVETE